MKKNLKIFLLAYFVFLLMNLISCNDGCGSNHSKYAKVTSFENELEKVEIVDGALHNYEIEDNSVLYSEFALAVYTNFEYYATNSFTSMNSLYACSLPIPEVKDVITNIEITANVAFNNTHLANTSLNEYFDIYTPFNGLQNLSDFLGETPLHDVSEETHFILKESPNFNKDIVFTVKIYLNGAGIDFYEFTANSIEVRTN